MAVTQRLELRQTQSLVMTPQLQQAIRLLQMSNLELTDFIESELTENPLLEREEGQEETASSESAAEPESGDDSLAEAGGQDSAELMDAESIPDTGEAPLDADYAYDGNSPSDDWGSGDWAQSGSGRGGSFNEDDDYSFEDHLCETPSLRDHLVEQLQLEFTEGPDRLIGQYLLDSLSEKGYLAIALEEAAEQLGIEEEEVERVLLRLQTFDPPGVFARDLRECLAIQLRDRNRLDPLMDCLLDHLDLLAKHDYDKLRRVCGVDEEDFAEMLSDLRSLDPRPAEAFDGLVSAPVVPDILMRARPDGSWHLELNPATLPRVLVREHYYESVVTRCRSSDEKSYLSEQLQAANWLVKALHQRANTILRVSSEIVRQQDAFFRKGVSHLKPLILRDVSEAIEMHESTVSRVTSNKFIATPRGIFELKYFFTTAISSSEGGQHSSESVRHRIKSLIEAETVNAILSDDSIVEMLQGEGIEIARRTVAKYREAMRIPSSVQRRRLKRSQCA